MAKRVTWAGWLVALSLIMGLLISPAAVMAQDDAATQAADDAAATTESDDIFDQAALPSVPDSALAGGFELLPIGFLKEMFLKGGNFMWPLLIASVIGIGVIIERFFTLSRAKVNTRKLVGEVVHKLKESKGQAGVQEAMDVCLKTRGPISAILYAGLVRAHKGSEAVEKAIESAGTIEMSFLQRGLIVLASIANVAPLLGFLGTVSGMINAFEAIAAADSVSAKLVATGISEALITTATGLLVAIPIQLANNFFISRIDGFVLEMEEASVELVDTLVDIEQGRA